MNLGIGSSGSGFPHRQSTILMVSTYMLVMALGFVACGEASTPTLQWGIEIGSVVTSSPVLGDIDRDHLLEVVVGSGSGKVYALNSDGTFVTGWPCSTRREVQSSPALGDIDGDGRLEVVVGSTDSSVYAWNHDGTPVPNWPRRTGNIVISSPGLGDIDGDGSLEIVIGCRDNQVYAWNGDGSSVGGSPGWPRPVGGWISNSSPALGDIDGDGSLEVVIGCDDGKVYAWHGDGTDVSGWPRTAGDSLIVASPALGDIDGDGRLEVVVGSWRGFVYAWNGENGTTVAGNWPVTIDGRNDSSPAIADLDGDGDLDVVVGSVSSQKVYAWDGLGNALPGWPVGAGGYVISSPAVGDIDGDGSLEVVVGSYDHSVHAWNHDGTVLPGWPLPTGNIVASSPALGDIDHDGALEVVIGSVDSHVYCWDLGAGSYAPARLPWPMFHHDRQRTGNFDFVPANVKICVPDDYPTIQDAIDAAANGDSICVAPGEYYENLVIENVHTLVITARYCDGACGWATVDPPTSVPAVRFSNVGSGVRFEGFVLTGGTCGMSLSDSDPQISNNIIHRNDSGLELTGSSPTLVSNVIADNLIYGVHLVSGASCPVLEGNIITGSMYGLYGVTTCCLSPHYNDVWGNTVNFGGACSGQWPPDQNISKDPKYANASVADYHLCVDSPCIDRGDPDSVMFDPDGSRNDMGAYGGSRACQDYPSYVKGLKAIAESAIVRLTWDANAQSESVSYYIVYRDTVSNFMPDATKHHRDVTGPSFADTVGLNKSCAYRIAAVNNHCYEGGYSVPITVETASLREGRLATSYYWGCGDESYIRGSVVAKGVGLKSTGSGTIVLAGVPQGANLLKTLLYWDRCPYVLLNGVRIGATKIGTDDGVSAYRADVSHIVNGNGTYEVATDGWSDGASLVVVYEDSTMDSLRAITINDGLDNEGHGSGGGAFDTTYFAHDQQESVYVCYVVGGGSAGLSDAYLYNGQPLALNACDATDGASWDTDWYLVPPEFVRPQPGHPQCSADVIEYTDSLHWIAAINLGLLLPAGVSNKNDGADYSWALAGVTPNPSGSASVVQFDVPEGGGTVSLMVYDAGGRLVSTLVDGRVDAGRHTVEWNATNGQGGQVAPGIYFIRMEAGSCRATKKVALVK